MMYIDPLIDWLMKTALLLAVAFILFPVGLVTGALIEIPHLLLGSNMTISHQVYGAVAALVFLFGSYCSMQLGLSVCEMTGFKAEYLGTALITAAVVPFGFMLTYQPRALNETTTVMFNFFFYAPLIMTALGMIILLLTPLIYTPCLHRYCIVRSYHF